MGLLSTAAKVARITNKVDVPDSSNLPEQSSIPKSKMNPLVKKRDLVDDTDTDFYSPVLSTIEQMTIGKKGSKGETISAFLQKRAPNVARSELDSFELDLDPQRLYTREELVELAKEKGSTKYSIEKVDSYADEMEEAQRQFVQDEEVDFVILTLQGEKDYLRGELDAHFGGTKNLGHTRSSIRREAPVEGKKTNDGDSYLLMEEIQSDTATKRSANNDAYSIVGITDVDTKQDISRHIFETFDELDTDFGLDFDVDIDKDVSNTIQKFYSDVYLNPELKTLGDVNIQKKLLKNKDVLKELLKKEHGITAEGLDIDKISHSAIRDTLQGDGDIENPYLSEMIENEISFLNSEIVDHYSEKFKVSDIKKSPILSRSDYLKKLILSNIVYAKKNNLTKIVIPNYKEIARQRTDTFDEVVDSSSPYYAKYEEAMKTGEHGKVAQEYFEGVFKKTYKDALEKVLNTLKKESDGTIKIGTRELRYGDLTQKKRYRTSVATEIDISQFEFDPNTEKLRFNKGGVPMQEQMEFFEDGGLKDEGGMVDEQSGNDVPVGSSRKEVRDDIPAMLSEGEFVFPADVVRYHGLDKLMDLRQQAKMGLKQMEAMGQMGNSEEATMPDDMPFGPSDLIIVGGEIEDGPREMAEGGVVYANQGTFATGIGGYQPSIYQGQQTSSTYTIPPSSVAPPAPAASPAGGYMPKFVTNQVTPNTAVGTLDVGTASVEDEFVPTIEDKYNSITYINKETNEKRDFYFYNGNPVTPIPDGFVPYDESVDETVSDLESTTVESTQVTSGSDDPPPMETPEPKDYGILTNADLKKAYAQNQTAVAIMAGLTVVNPIFGLFGSWATRSTRNTITEEMKKRGIKVPESTGIKGVFGSIVDGIKDMLGLDDDQTTAVKSSVEKDNSPPKIYEPKDPTKGDFSTSSSSGIVKVTPSKSVQDSVTINDKDPMEQFGGSGSSVASSPVKDNSPPKDMSSATYGNSSDKAKAMSIARQSGNVSTKTAASLSGSQMEAGSGVGAGAGGTDYAGPMNKGGLASRKNKKKKR